ncbi:hypothetical protein [Paraburkholderia hayleyella]|uniref:hypothetical protein n=1 Tax=Paraburkholderia hayleyella TaxID=2152889 RepID=UPI0012918086|nr:hypothetical protein [Paraburkholderia hayleyella]
MKNYLFSGLVNKRPAQIKMEVWPENKPPATFSKSVEISSDSVVDNSIKYPQMFHGTTFPEGGEIVEDASSILKKNNINQAPSLTAAKSGSNVDPARSSLMRLQEIISKFEFPETISTRVYDEHLKSGSVKKDFEKNAPELIMEARENSRVITAALGGAENVARIKMLLVEHALHVNPQAESDSSGSSDYLLADECLRCSALNYARLHIEAETRQKNIIMDINRKYSFRLPVEPPIKYSRLISGDGEVLLFLKCDTSMWSNFRRACNQFSSCNCSTIKEKRLFERAITQYKCGVKKSEFNAETVKFAQLSALVVFVVVVDSISDHVKNSDIMKYIRLTQNMWPSTT